MGKLLYSEAEIDIEFDDRALAHLQIVIGAKLRRNENFFFSWKDDPSSGNGRASIWLDCAIPLYFKFFGSKVPTINREWIALLNQSANSGAGLVFIPEPGEMYPVLPKAHV